MRSKAAAVMVLVLAAALALGAGGTASAAGKTGGKAGAENGKGGMALEVGYFKPSLEFKAHYVSAGQIAEDINFKQIFAMPDKNSAEYRLWISGKLRLSYTNWNYSGTNRLTQDVSYGDATFPINASASVNLGVQYWRLTWLRPLAKSKAAEYSWLIEVKSFRFKTEVTGHDSISGTTKTARKDFRGTVPTFGFRMETKPQGAGGRGLSVYGEMSGLPAGKYGYLYDFEAGLKYHFDKYSSVAVAYRNIDINLKDGKADGEKARLKQAGPYFQLASQF